MTLRNRILVGALLGASLGASCALNSTTGPSQVRVEVVEAEGRPLRTFECSVHPRFDGGVGGPVPGVSIVRAGPNAVQVRGLPPGDYVVEVRAEGYAKEYSPLFSISGGGDERSRVRVVLLNEGGGIRGCVRDEHGRPIAGACVTTLPHGFLRNPFTDMFPIHFEVTNRTIRTNRRGVYEFQNLRPGQYQVEIGDEEYSSKCVGDIAVVRSAVVTMDDVTLVRGCELSGVATLKGKLSDQIVVEIAPVEPSHGSYLFRRSARTDAKSRFRIPVRLPPGRYELTHRESGYAIYLHMQREIVEIKPGQAKLKIKVDTLW